MYVAFFKTFQNLVFCLACAMAAACRIALSMVAGGTRRRRLYKCELITIVTLECVFTNRQSIDK